MTIISDPHVESKRRTTRRAKNTKADEVTGATVPQDFGIELGLGRGAVLVSDAVLSMRLLHAYTAVQHDARAVQAMGEKVLAQKPKPSFAKLHAEWEGCCMGNRQTCKCGAPFFS